MRKLLWATTALIALSALPASANVTLDTHLSGTGTNVIFQGVIGDTATALLNGQNPDIVTFQSLDVNTFNAAANGNDIKINGTNNLQIKVFDAGLNLLGTTTEVFSLEGTGTVTFFVTAVDAFGAPELFQFTNVLDANGQNGFTLHASDGEVMTAVRIFDQGGTLTNFEHFRIDVAAVPLAEAVPEPATWAMMLAGFFGIGGYSMLRRRRDGQAFRLA